MYKGFPQLTMVIFSSFAVIMHAVRHSRCVLMYVYKFLCVLALPARFGLTCSYTKRPENSLVASRWEIT